MGTRLTTGGLVMVYVWHNHSGYVASTQDTQMFGQILFWMFL